MNQSSNTFAQTLDLHAIRLLVLKRMCLIWAVLGGAIVAIVAADDVWHGRHAAAAFYVASYALVILCLLPKLFPYWFRCVVPLVALYIVGSHEIYHHGLNSAGNLFYFGLILFSCALAGARVAAVVMVASTVSMCLLSYLYRLQSPPGTPYGSFLDFAHRECLPDVVSLVLLSSMAITFLSILLRTLEHSLETSQGYLAEIAHERNQLIQLIEERDRTASQLQQAQKMEAVGQLAGGIAHDFNNLLQVVCAHTDILLRQASPGTGQHDQLNEVRKASERAAALTRQLLAYSRQQVMSPEYIDLNKRVDEMVRMLHRLIPESIEIRLEPGEDLGTVHADPSQIEQVLMNLCLNARDAMPLGGTLLVATENIELDEAFAAENPWAEAGEFVKVTIRDTGTGIDPAKQEHIFEPFFTTKKVGEGTGLGLSMAYGIVKQHRGLIEVNSTPLSGTEFGLYLPRVEHPAVDREPETPVVQAAGGHETILVAEDDEAVRALIVGVLQSSGFAVLPAENGAEALALFESHQQDIDLLLFDIVMPRMGGKEACEAIRATHPDVRVLFMSGYAPEGLNGRIELGRRTGFIQKPYRTQDLIKKIRETLEA